MEGKRKVLFLISTYFQLITALQLVRTEYTQDVVDFLITDSSNQYELVAERIERLHIVHKVYIARVKDLVIPKGIVQKAKTAISLVLNKRFVSRRIGENLGRYDVFLFYNLDCFTYSLYFSLVDDNSNIAVCRFEEGYGIYLAYSDRPKSERLSEKICWLLRRRSVKQDISGVYLYHPEFLTYEIKLPIKRIEILSNKDRTFVTLLNRVFDYRNTDSIGTKFVLFEECFYADGWQVDDQGLFNSIADEVSSEDLTIKLHPRNRINRFADTNIHVMRNSSIPWEVIQMNNDYRDKVFLTVSSGSVLASTLYFGENIPTIFLYRLIGGNYKLREHFEEYLNQICQTSKNDIFIPETREELTLLLQHFTKMVQED